MLATTNAVNLIDGVDGVGPGVIMISACALTLLALGLGDPTSALLFGATCGAAGGFLVFNRQPASIFLGDSGSLLLGFLIGATSAAGCTKGATALSLVGALFALAVPFLDAVQSFVRRFRASFRYGGFSTALQATTIADRGHIHHRMLFRGLSPNRIALILCLVTTITSLSALLMLPGGVHWGASVATTIVGVLVLFRLGSIGDTAGVADDVAADDESGDAPRPPTDAPSRPLGSLPDCAARRSGTGRPGSRTHRERGLIHMQAQTTTRVASSNGLDHPR